MNREMEKIIMPKDEGKKYSYRIQTKKLELGKILVRVGPAVDKNKNKTFHV